MYDLPLLLIQVVTRVFEENVVQHQQVPSTGEQVLAEAANEPEKYARRLDPCDVEAGAEEEGVER